MIIVHVEEGQAVERGDLLLELDSTTHQADKERVTTELLSTQAGLARIQALLKALDSRRSDPEMFFNAPNTMAQTILNTQSWPIPYPIGSNANLPTRIPAKTWL